MVLPRVPDAEVSYNARDARYYRDGMLFTGIAQAWHRSGEPRSELGYRHGLRWGRGCDWYTNGQLSCEGYFVSDMRHGISREWHRDGTLALETEYDRGLVLREREWDESGALLRDERCEPMPATTADGSDAGQSADPHSIRRAWYPDGSPEGEAVYEFGIMVSQREWAPDGTLIEDYRLDPEEPESAELAARRGSAAG